MPYPLSKLPYGLRCRLSKLATPVERYNLQLAAGNLSICPPNIQLVKKLSGNFDFFSVNGAVTMFHGETIIEDELLHDDKNLFMIKQLTYSIYLTGFSSGDFKSNIFDHILFEQPRFFLEECRLSKLFYTTFRRAYPNVQSIAIPNCNNVSYVFNFTDLLNVFHKLERLTVCCCINSNWITEILQSKNRSLLSLTLNFNTESKKFERLKPDDLLTLLNAQQRGFKLWIQVKDKPANFSELKQFLDKNLAQKPTMNCTSVSIFYGAEYNTWYLP